MRTIRTAHAAKTKSSESKRVFKMDFSFSEIFLIVLVAFLVFGPEKLPDVARKTGRLVRKAKSLWQSITTEIENTTSPSEQNHHEK